jgi:hypothetical protein
MRCTDAARRAHARQPADEVRLAFVVVAGKMRPLVRGHDRPFERQQIGDDERFEEHRIGHPVDDGATEIEVQERVLRSRGHGETRGAKIALRRGEPPTRLPGRPRAHPAILCCARLCAARSTA